MALKLANISPATFLLLRNSGFFPLKLNFASVFESVLSLIQTPLPYLFIPFLKLPSTYAIGPFNDNDLFFFCPFRYSFASCSVLKDL
jgi:hypothetical protein